ncbi:hypothetical protein EDD11_008858 [Mortierella claussenii]|nr:hypothetical protein EDD11_008858 [Mortierella claussenii]
MANMPTFASPCIAPDNTGQNAFLFGAPSPGRLEAHFLDLSDPSAPKSQLVSSTTTSAWTSELALGCFSYLGDNPPSTSPISIVQFGSPVQALFFPNGTWVTTSLGPSLTGAPLEYVSPKFFSLVGSTDGWSWFLAKASIKGADTAAFSWRDVRIGSALQAGSTDSTIMGSDPSSSLLTVGAIAQDTNNFGNGLLFAFDQSGSSGTVYRALGNKKPDRNLTAAESLVNLTKISAVDMGGSVLSSDAVPVTSSFAAFILDKGPGGTISVYSIDPRSSSYSLVQSLVSTMAPLFLTGQSITSLNSKIVVLGGHLADGSGTVTNSLHVFDVISGTWSGPGLVDPASSAGKTRPGGLGGGVIGGIVAAVLVLVVAVCFAIWRIRGNKEKKVKKMVETMRKQQELDSMDMQKKDTIIKMFDLERKSQSVPARKSEQQEHKCNQNQQYHGKHRHNESDATLAGAVASTPNTPKTPRHHVDNGVQRSNTYHHHHQQRRSSRRSSQLRHATRQPSTFSVRSDGSSCISLLPAGSNIILVDSPPLLPPTPLVPTTYNTGAIDSQPQPPRVSKTDTSAVINLASATKNSKKLTVYKVNVPDDYDDRQPLHRSQQGSTVDEHHSNQHASTVTASDSPASVSISWTGTQDHYQHQYLQSTEKSQRSKTRSRTHESRAISQQSSPATTATGLTGAATVASSPEQMPSNIDTRQKKKNKSILVYPRSRGDPISETAATVEELQYDSGTYKVELEESKHLSDLVSHTTLNLGMPVMSAPDTGFIEAFPLPPKPSPTSPTHPSSSATSPAHHHHHHQQQQYNKQRRQQQHQQYMDWYQQQQQIQLEQQQLAEMYGAGTIPQSPKTPKLGSLPRPIPRALKKTTH